MSELTLDNVRILEIGENACRSAFPDQAINYSLSPPRLRGRLGQGDPRSLAEFIGVLRAGAFDLIVCGPNPRSPWHWQTLTRSLFSRSAADHLKAPLRHFGPQMLRFWRDKPVVAVDFEDTHYIERDKFFLLDRGLLYFKRELPADEWQLFTKTACDTLPSRRLRAHPGFRRRTAKLRPLPLGLPRGSELDLPSGPVPKEADLFFSGRVPGLPVRERAMSELAALRAEGVRIDIADGPLPRPEFYKRCASAWLTLSPHGYGWDCFRHYEAGACGSVPVINRTGNRRHEPLRDGEHALFYDPEPGDLTRVVREALADKKRLARIAEASRTHVLTHHTHAGVMRYVVRTSLAAINEGEARAPF